MLKVFAAHKLDYIYDQTVTFGWQDSSTVISRIGTLQESDMTWASKFKVKYVYNAITCVIIHKENFVCLFGA